MRSNNNGYSSVVSLDALEQVNFHNYWLIAKRRWKPTVGVFAATVMLAGFGASIQKPTYTANGKLLLRSNHLPSLTGLGGELTGRVSNLTLQSNPVRTEAETITSEPIVKRTIEALNLQDDEGKPVHPEGLAKKIKVKEVAGADVFRVTYEDNSPEQAAAVINQLMQEYTKSNVLENRSEAAAAKEFIAAQLPKTEAIVREADIALRRFKERSGISDLKGEEQLLTGTIGELEKEITGAKTELSELNTRLASLRGRLKMSTQQALGSNTLSQAPGVQQVLAQLQQVQAQLRLERTRFHDQHPVVVDLVEKEITLKMLLQERISNTVGDRAVSESDLTPGDIRQGLMKAYVDAELQHEGVTSRLTSLIASRNTYRNRVVQVPRLEQEQRELQRRMEAAQSTYESLLKKLQEVELTEKQNVGTARIIENASVPERPAGSKANVMLLLGSILATLLALGMVTFLELRDKTIKTIKEARDLFGYTWLGTIPLFGKAVNLRPNLHHRSEWSVPELPVRDAPRSTVSASYRMLQANLKFLSLDAPLRSVVITSSVPKEGKSTVAANLAATMAQLGRRTLLIDADMHCPIQHHVWDLVNADGLSHVLVEQSSVRDSVVSVLENLDVLPCGVLPPNPLALLDSKRMASLVQTFEQEYDFVILDAPPLVVEAEALTLGRIADGILLVVRPDVVDFASANLAKELLQQSSQNILGMVVNSALPENEVRRSYSSRGSYGEPSVAKAI